MKFSVAKKDLSVALSFCNKILRLSQGVSEGTELSGQYVLLEATKKEMWLTAAKYGTYVKHKVECTIETPGKLVVDPGYLDRLPFNGKNSICEIEVTAGDGSSATLSYKSGRAKGSLTVHTNADVVLSQFPDEDKVPQELKTELDFESLKGYVSSVIFPADYDPSYDSALGLPIRIKTDKKGNLELTASNNLSAMMVKGSVESKHSIDMTISNNILSAIMSCSQAKMFLGVAEDQFRAKNDVMDLVCPFDELQVAQVEEYLKDLGKPTNKVILNANDFVNAVSDASVSSAVAGEKTPIIDIKVQSKGIVSLSTKASIGKSTASCECTAKKDFSFKGLAYMLIDYVNMFDGTVTISLYDGVAVVSNETESHLAILSNPDV